jgi:predicted transcriptional regulator
MTEAVELIHAAERLVRIESSQAQLADSFTQLRAELTRLLSEMREQTTQATSMATLMRLECVRRGEQSIQMSKLLAQHDDRIEAVEKMAPALRILSWVGTALAGSIIALIWAIITGRADVVFK